MLKVINMTLIDPVNLPGSEIKTLPEYTQVTGCIYERDEIFDVQLIFPISAKINDDKINIFGGSYLWRLSPSENGNFYQLEDGSRVKIGD